MVDIPIRRPQHAFKKLSKPNRKKIVFGLPTNGTVNLKLTQSCENLFYVMCYDVTLPINTPAQEIKCDCMPDASASSLYKRNLQTSELQHTNF